MIFDKHKLIYNLYGMHIFILMVIFADVTIAVGLLESEHNGMSDDKVQ